VDTGKAEVLHAVFAPVSTNNVPHALALSNKVGGGDEVRIELGISRELSPSVSMGCCSQHWLLPS